MEPHSKVDKEIVVAISGLHGTGKSTYAHAIAKEFNLRVVSAGKLFRKLADEKGISLEELSRISGTDSTIDLQIDERTKSEAKSGAVIVEGRLAGWMTKDESHIKILLTAPNQVRFRRIAERENLSLEEAKRITLFREDQERKRFKKYYGIDLDDNSIYDLIINTNKLPLNSCIKVIKEFIREYIKALGG
jgi:cytidylate kinase